MCLYIMQNVYEYNVCMCMYTMQKCAIYLYVIPQCFNQFPLMFDLRKGQAKFIRQKHGQEGETKSALAR